MSFYFYSSSESFLSFAAATLSRAAAGTVGDAVVYALPGSPDAVRLAFERLISPEIEHVVWEMGR